MRLPRIDKAAPVEWPENTLLAWKALEERVSTGALSIGKGGAFQRLVKLIEACSRRGQDLPDEVYQSRPGIRALTWLWLQSEAVRDGYLHQESLEAMLSSQDEQLSRMAVIQLAQLYFREHDRLSKDEKGLTESLGVILVQQVYAIQSRARMQGKDVIAVIHREGWLMENNGPASLVEKCLETGLPLDDYVARLGLEGYMDGRFGEVCRAIYYIRELEKVPVGEHHDVLNEIVKERVSKAPYQGSIRVGHAALKILIDRTEGEPSDLWQNVILTIAGDPRVSGTNRQFAEWWAPLGDDRVNKVRGWLAREDLRLFLNAVESYGIESGDASLQRMFPARKRFLEGIFNNEVVGNTRLMLGSRAEYYVKRIVGKDMLTSYATLEGGMSDKAVIYLDCGDFHIVEGSHLFKIWVYEKKPSDSLLNYGRNSFSHQLLTKTIPGEYVKNNPGKQYLAETHSPTTWRRRVLEFLIDHDVELDWSKLFEPNEWRDYRAQFGIPTKVVRRILHYKSS